MVSGQLIKHVLETSDNYEEWTTNRYNQLICPCDNCIEIDGNCPNGHISPVRQEGMI